MKIDFKFHALKAKKILSLKGYLVKKQEIFGYKNSILLVSFNQKVKTVPVG